MTIKTILLTITFYSQQRLRHGTLRKQILKHANVLSLHTNSGRDVAEKKKAFLPIPKGCNYYSLKHLIFTKPRRGDIIYIIPSGFYFQFLYFL